MKRAFTLMEVNLAIFIMAVGVLAMVSLYPLGFRESAQSREDVAAAAMAEAVLNPLVGALSSTNMHWTEWLDICEGRNGRPKPQPDGRGWLGYCRDTSDNSDYRPLSRSGIRSKSDAVIAKIQRAYSSSQGKGDAGSGMDGAQTLAGAMANEMCYALVANFGTKEDEDGQRAVDYSVISLCFRSCRHPAQLFSQPIFYTEVHFQGDPNK